MIKLLMILGITTCLSMFGITISDAASSPKCDTFSSWSITDPDSYSVQYDADCRALYVEAPPLQLLSKQLAKSNVSSTSSTFNPSSAFMLHSNPNAPAIIYLDFDGQIWQEGSWWLNAYGIEVGRYSPGFTLDNDPLSFTTAERNAIYEMWVNVAEEFSMYNVDVTTERPTGSRETIFKQNGSHALVLSDTLVQNGCGCGGVAYLNVFGYGDAWDYPALNFSKFGDYYAASWDVAEIISHEVGHNLGLAHDGTTTGIEYYFGHNMWTPIMGAGRGRGIATWSYGGYPYADTRWDQPLGDNDFSQMGMYLGLLNDDYGNTPSTAASLNNLLNSVQNASISGKITTATDVDVFEIVIDEGNSGLWEFYLRPIAYGVNLDPQLTLSDARGTTITMSNPLVPDGPYYGYVSAGLDASISAQLAVGTYYLAIEGVGQGSLALGTGYDDYASLGNYTLEIQQPISDLRVVAVSPISVSYGTAVAIRGYGLTHVTKVTLKGKPLTQFTIVNPNLLVFGVPARMESGELVVESATDTLVAVKNFRVSNKNARATITRFSPTSGSPGSIVAVTGTNLGAATKLMIGEQEIDFQVTGINSLSFVVSNSLNSGKLTVTTAGATVTSSREFQVKLPPVLSLLEPARGAIGSTISIQGSNFTSDSIVTFYGEIKATRTTVTPNQILVVVPKKAITGPVTVRNSLGSSTSSVSFEVIPAPPVITRISPTSARVGATITVTGRNFIGVSKVDLAGKSIDFRVVSPSQIRFVVPSDAVSGKITVTTPSGTAESTSTLQIR